MTLVLQLPPELEADLASEAAQLGLSLPDYALRLLAGAQNPPSSPRTGAELVAYWQTEGLIGMRPDITDAPTHARFLREQAQKRTRP